MRKLISLCALTLLLCTACATYTAPGYWRAPDRAEVNRSKDDLECRAIAGQAAAGAGGWTSVSPVQAAFYDHAKQQYYVQCLRSRGYAWVAPR